MTVRATSTVSVVVSTVIAVLAGGVSSRWLCVWSVVDVMVPLVVLVHRLGGVLDLRVAGWCVVVENDV